MRLNLKLRKNLHPIPTPSFAALAYCIQSSCWILKHNWAVEGNNFQALLAAIKQGVGKIQFGLEADIWHHMTDSLKLMAAKVRFEPNMDIGYAIKLPQNRDLAPKSEFPEQN